MSNETVAGADQVWIRGAAWIRGFCTGYVAAFDKQWNLALTDVDETFTQKRRRKTPLLGQSSSSSSSSSSSFRLVLVSCVPDNRLLNASFVPRK